MDESKLKVLADFAALKYTLELIGKIACVAAGVNGDLVTQMRANVREQLASETFPGIDPALSDHFSAEVEARVDSILSGIEANVKAAERLAGLR